MALLWNPVPPGARSYKDAAERVARKLGAHFQSVEVRGRNELETAFAAMRRERTDGVVVATDPIFVGDRSEVVVLALRDRLPTVYGLKQFLWRPGAAYPYGEHCRAQFGAAFYVDKIFKGANPADLPVEQPTKFELVINLKTAKALGLTIPQSLLLRADEVIQ